MGVGFNYVYEMFQWKSHLWDFIGLVDFFYSRPEDEVMRSNTLSLIYAENRKFAKGYRTF